MHRIFIIFARVIIDIYYGNQQLQYLFINEALLTIDPLKWQDLERILLCMQSYKYLY